VGDATEQRTTSQVQGSIRAAVDIERVVKVRREVAIDPVKERLGSDGTLWLLMPESKVCTGCSVWGCKDAATIKPSTVAGYAVEETIPKRWLAYRAGSTSRVGYRVGCHPSGMPNDANV
jgi:hypothetical protein